MGKKIIKKSKKNLKYATVKTQEDCDWKYDSKLNILFSTLPTYTGFTI